MIQVKFKDQPVITTSFLAETLGVDVNLLTQNFRNNKLRYEEGKHYFLLKGAELKEFKNYLENLGLVQIGKRSPHFYLWTERGLLNHAKSINTDQAWKSYDHLVDTYFRFQEAVKVFQSVQKSVDPKYTLEAYIADEKRPWKKAFKDALFEQIYRLHGWECTPETLKNKPSIIGKYLNDYIYNMLPPGVADFLRKNTPRNESGQYVHKLHQKLTIDIGLEHLKDQVAKVTGIMSVSHNWAHFNELFRISCGQTTLDLGQNRLGD